MTHDTIAVVDFGGQYAHLIATKVRKNRVLAEIRQPEDPTGLFKGYKGIIISGSPSLSSHGEDSEYNKEIYDLDVPILGFCFGHQEIAKRYGGKVIHGGREWGAAKFRILKKHPLFDGLDEVEQVFMSHFDSVVSVGIDFEEYGYSFLADEKDAHRFAALGSDKYRRYGFQFHPEVDDTIHGDRMIGNFVFKICGCIPSWTMDRYIEEHVGEIRRKVGSGSVFLLASGGVDSTVAAKLLGLALGPDRLHLLHIDNGLMRKDESRTVIRMFEKLGLSKNLHFVDASEDFLGALSGETEPERKRRIIGDTFIEVFEREAKELGIEGHLLGQGTIYPDTIETGGTKRADKIKTHHNRVPIIEKMISGGRVIEPLAELYKVEVRELGEKLGIPHEAVWRHPFPGPGLGVRLLCSDGSDNAELTDRITRDAQLLGVEYGVSAMVLPVRSVGVKADLRSYEHPVMLTVKADGGAGFEQLRELAGEIFKTVRGVNRCVLNLAPNAPFSAMPVKAAVTRERLDLLRECDSLVMEGLQRHGLYDVIWQCPTVLVPLSLDGKGCELVIVRPVYSERAMTAEPAPLPSNLLSELGDRILALDEVTGLAIDITSKPPGTIEWE